MRRLETAIGALVRAMAWTATIAGILLSGFVALSAIMRYVVGAPFAFTEEFVGLLFSAMIFLVLPFCTHADRHIRVTLVRDRLPARWRHHAGVASTLLTLVFCAVFGYFAFDFAWMSLTLNAKSDMGRVPLWPWMAAMPFACLVMAMAAILRRDGRSPGRSAADP